MNKKTTLRNAFAAVKAKWTENKQEMRSHLREFVRDAAKAKIAGEPFELAEHESDVLLSLLEAEGLEPVDFERNADELVKRIQQAELAAMVPSLTAEARRLEDEVQKFQQDLWLQHEANLKRLTEMDFAAVEARTKLYRAAEAEGDYRAGGEVTAAEREAAEQKTAVSRKIAELAVKLTKCRPYWLAGNMAASVAEFPVLAAIEAEREIEARKRTAKPGADVNVEGIARCERIIKASRAAVSEIEKEIAKLEKQGDSIDRTLRELAACRPFELVRTAKRALTHA